jgi:hypothetical protein
MIGPQSMGVEKAVTLRFACHPLQIFEFGIASVEEAGFPKRLSNRQRSEPGARQGRL